MFDGSCAAILSFDGETNGTGEISEKGGFFGIVVERLILFSMTMFPGTCVRSVKRIAFDGIEFGEVPKNE